MDKRTVVHFEANWKKNLYEVIFVYSPDDVLPDVAAMFKEGEESSIEIIEVWSTTMEAAISNAWKIVLASRADMFTDYIVDNPIYADEDKETWTKEELKRLHKIGVMGNVFTDFMMIEPTSVQVCRKANKQVMEDMSLKNMDKAISNISTDAEKFLKGDYDE